MPLSPFSRIQSDRCWPSSAGAKVADKIPSFETFSTRPTKSSSEAE